MYRVLSTRRGVECVDCRMSRCVLRTHLGKQAGSGAGWRVAVAWYWVFAQADGLVVQMLSRVQMLAGQVGRVQVRKCAILLPASWTDLVDWGSEDSGVRAVDYGTADETARRGLTSTLDSVSSQSMSTRACVWPAAFLHTRTHTHPRFPH